MHGDPTWENATSWYLDYFGVSISLKVRWQRPLSVPFLFRTSGKGTDNITKFHMCSHWVWQPCEVMPFCKHIDDTRKSDSFNQVNELKSFGRKFQWNQGEKVWQKRNHRETWDNTCYLKIIATLGAVLVNLVEMWIYWCSPTFKTLKRFVKTQAPNWWMMQLI